MLLYTTAVRRRRPRPACVTVGSRGSASSLWNGHNPFQACVLRARPIFEGRPPVPHGPRASRWDNSSRQRVLGCLKSTAHELRRSEHLLCCFIPRGTSAYLSYVILRTPEDSIPHEYIYTCIYMWSIANTDSSPEDSENSRTISASNRDPFASSHGPLTCFPYALSARV